MSFNNTPVKCCRCRHKHDALGLVSESHTRYPRVPDVKFDVLDEDVETEIIT